ncbi:glycosyltransferase family 4 protein [Aquincola sp. J276]|uniref:glycosyltransferase family 4 protein n=1 Tax=Aquincola sp. J276 TaxID=2898432 RepID=UPI0021515A0D|nr:glycosyltransferase family 4 protein [Aquincola sp. J276]MCR5868802.1 glycosyltransferase family 4 protein [Aquincola sp. J276]
MKVAFISTLYAPNEMGGAERTVRVLAEALAHNGDEAVVISLAWDGQARQAMVGPVKAYYVPLANLHWPFLEDRPSALRRALWHAIDAYNPVMGARVGAILDIEQPDVLQTGNLLGFSVAAWRAAARRRIPVVQMLHDYYLACPNSSMFRHGSNCRTQCGDCRAFCTPRRLLSNIPVAVTSLSARTLEKVEGAGNFRKVPLRYIAHGANNVHAQPEPRTDRAPGGNLKVGYLGRIERTKGIEVLLDAAAAMAPGAVTVMLAGKGEEAYTQSLRARYPNADIVFLGFTKPGDLFAQIDLLVVPSLWEEPLGRVIYEAYEYGVPSAVSRAGGMPEIVEEGRTGFVFEAGNASALAAILERERAAGWAAGRFFNACRAKSREFNMDSLFARYAEIWTTASRTGPRPASA